MPSPPAAMLAIPPSAIFALLDAHTALLEARPLLYRGRDRDARGIQLLDYALVRLSEVEATPGRANQPVPA